QLLQKIPMVLVDEPAEARAQIVPSRTVRAALGFRAGAGRELYAMDGEELIDVGAEDGEELHALAQRHPGIAYLREHATVGLEPRELPDAIRHHAVRRKSRNGARAPLSLQQDGMIVMFL